jgi:nucleoside-triphosphatase
MSQTKTNILITGYPGVGKTTLIRKLAAELAPFRPAGFYTAEIREKGIRHGFELVDLDGRKFVLAHVDLETAHRVGKYGVDIDGFEHYLASSNLLHPGSDLVIIDEIGKMECLSTRFRETLNQIVKSPALLIATIAYKGEGTIADLKRRPDVTLFEITLRNRDTIRPAILEIAGAFLKPGPPP